MSAFSGDDLCIVRVNECDVVGFKIVSAVDPNDSVTVLGDSITIVVNAGFGADAVATLVSVAANDGEVTVTDGVCGVECSVAISGCLIDIAGSDWSIGCC